ncbi:MAG: response regulator transcription factor [Elusimicrobiota bacterium]
MENRLKILVADDETDITDLLKSYFLSMGHECEVVNNGRDALRVASEKTFDVILVDVMMPYMDGYHLTHQITSSLKNPPIIIIITSRDTQFEKGIAKMSGAYEIVQKPFNLDDLMKTINNAVLSRRNNENSK